MDNFTTFNCACDIYDLEILLEFRIGNTNKICAYQKLSVYEMIAFNGR